MIKIVLVALLLLLAGIPTPTHAEKAALDASLESQELAAYIQEGYQDYLRDYLHVFLGYNLCKYSFVDENVLNALADDVLKRMAERAEEMIHARHGADPQILSPEAVHYAAQLAVLTTMGMAATTLTAELSPSYQDKEATCSSTAEANRQRYARLKAFKRP